MGNIRPDISVRRVDDPTYTADTQRFYRVEIEYGL